MKKKFISLIPSPCISVCTMDEETGYCLGCCRTLEEISGWEGYNDIEKQKIIDRLAARHDGMQSPHC